MDRQYKVLKNSQEDWLVVGARCRPGIAFMLKEAASTGQFLGRE